VGVWRHGGRLKDKEMDVGKRNRFEQQNEIRSDEGKRSVQQSKAHMLLETWAVVECIKRCGEDDNRAPRGVGYGNSGKIQYSCLGSCDNKAPEYLVCCDCEEMIVLLLEWKERKMERKEIGAGEAIIYIYICIY
jgi:hypothetical protein